MPVKLYAHACAKLCNASFPVGQSLKIIQCLERRKIPSACDVNTLAESAALHHTVFMYLPSVNQNDTTCWVDEESHRNTLDNYPPTWEHGSGRPYGTIATETIQYLDLGLPQNHYLTAVRSRVPHVHSHRTSLNGRFNLWGSEWSLRTKREPIGTARMVMIQGQKNEIINTWVFPKYPSLLPVFAAELIELGGHQRLSFIDIQTPGLKLAPSSVSTVTHALRNKHGKLVIDESPPAWAVTDTLGDYIFRRTGCDSQFPAISSAYHDYLKALLNDIWPSILSENHEQASIIGNTDLDPQMSLLRDYQLHHLHSSPGNEFLSKLFGNQWTNDFLHNFLFSQP